MINRFKSRLLEDYETCMRLRNHGFNVWCKKCYVKYPYYRGQPLGSDEEFELRAEGKAKAIRYKMTLYDMNNSNTSFHNETDCSCPEINDVLDWFLINWNVHIIVKPYWLENHQISWFYDIFFINENYIELKNTGLNFKDKYQAYTEAIKWVMTNLI